ncbi:group II intron maturase-specific domain-containing protein [Leptodesmis sp.]|uniref:group II intron maturase-specific domain-containing protein n=1 Tax=Leptodesmis sp. TaxID=3100501 RepID=UPI0040535737
MARIEPRQLDNCEGASPSLQVQVVTASPLPLRLVLFLGFTVRQFPAGKHFTAHNASGTPLGFKTLIQPSQTSIKRHQEKLKQIIQRHQAATQAHLIDVLNPVIIGWSNYFSTAVSSEAYQ